MQLDQFNRKLYVEEEFNETGFKNEKIKLTAGELLSNIKTVQQNNNVKISDSLKVKSGTLR